MTFGHEKLDVYRISIEYVGWVYNFCENLKGHRNAKDQILRASQSIPLNIAEGNGKATAGDRRRYFEIARGSAMECCAVQDRSLIQSTYHSFICLWSFSSGRECKSQSSVR